MSILDQAVMLIDAGQLEPALTSLQTLLLDDRENAEAWALTGRILLAQAQPERALAAVRRALALRAGFACAWDILSDVELALGDAPGAELAIERALSLDGQTFARLDVCLRIAHVHGRPAADVLQRFASAHAEMMQAAALPMARLLAQEPARAALRPTIAPAQQMLLHILFSPRHHTATEFQNWINAVDIKDLENGSYRLYPFLYRKLVEVAPDHPLIQFIKGNYRKTFYRNNLLLHRVSRRIQEMKNQGIDVLVLKGAALVESFAQDMGLRPMADVDILVRKEDVSAAMTILSGGYAPLDERILAHICRYRHGYTLADSYGFETDLHWSLNDIANVMEIDLEDLWKESEAGSLFGVDVRFLNATDQLFHLCVHGVQWNPEPPVRWIADAMTMLRDPNIVIKWDRLIDIAVHMKCALLLRCALWYLVEEFSAPIPPGVLAKLEEVPVTPSEWHLFPFQVTAPGEQASYEAITALASDLLLRWRRQRPECRLVLRLQATGLDARLADWCKRYGVDWVIHGPRFNLAQPAVRRTSFQVPPQHDDVPGFGSWHGLAEAGTSAGELFKASLNGIEHDAHVLDARIGYGLGFAKSGLLSETNVPLKTVLSGQGEVTHITLQSVTCPPEPAPVSI